MWLDSYLASWKFAFLSHFIAGFCLFCQEPIVWVRFPAFEFIGQFWWWHEVDEIATWKEPVGQPSRDATKTEIGLYSHKAASGFEYKAYGAVNGGGEHLYNRSRGEVRSIDFLDKAFQAIREFRPWCDLHSFWLVVSLQSKTFFCY